MTPSPFEMGNHSPTAPLHPQRKVENWALTEGRPAPLMLRLCCYQHKLMTRQWLPRTTPLCIPWFVTSWMLNRIKGWVLGGSKTAEGLSPLAAQGLSVTGLINTALAHVSPRVEARAALCPGAWTGEPPAETPRGEAPGLQCPLVWQRDLTNRGLAQGSSLCTCLSFRGVPTNPGRWEG